jgi:hypothetical protein
MALLAALAFATAGSAAAQDTTEVGRAAIDTTQPAGGAIDTAGADTSAVGDTTATSGVQNPPGYRGMERDTTMVPPSRTGRDSVSGTGGDSAAIDTARGDAYTPERPAGGDTAVSDTAGAEKGDAHRSERPAAADSAAHDSMQHDSGSSDGTQ